MTKITFIHAKFSHLFNVSRGTWKIFGSGRWQPVGPHIGDPLSNFRFRFAGTPKALQQGVADPLRNRSGLEGMRFYFVWALVPSGFGHEQTYLGSLIATTEIILEGVTPPLWGEGSTPQHQKALTRSPKRSVQSRKTKAKPSRRSTLPQQGRQRSVVPDTNGDSLWEGLLKIGPKHVNFPTSESVFYSVENLPK